ncbi:MAG: glycosyltransferase family 4 protein [Lachnotalea sp.]
MTRDNLMNSRKICHITSAHSRYDVRIFHKECKSLANNGYNVTLIVNDNFPDENIDGVWIVSTRLKPRNRFERMIKSKSCLREKMLKVNAEVYHFHDPELLPEAMWIKRKGKKVIFDFHEDVSQQILFKIWIPKPIRKFVSVIYKKYEKDKAKEFDALITVTPKFVERLEKINPNTVMITNYPILEEKEEKVDSKKKRAICFAGGISPQWNHENIISAIEGIDDIEYLLAGSGTEEYLEELKKLEGWKKVNYMGRIPHEKVKEIYNKSMIGMTLLSNNTQVGDEGTLGNTKIFEFMEARLPIICSNNKLWKEITERYKCGIAVDPDSVMDIRNSLILLLSDSTLMQEMGKNGENAVKTIYNWNQQEKYLFDLYDRICAKKIREMN